MSCFLPCVIACKAEDPAINWAKFAGKVDGRPYADKDTGSVIKRTTNTKNGLVKKKIGEK